MSGMRAVLVLGGSLFVSLALSLGIMAAAEDPHPEPSANLGVEWDYQPSDLVDLVRQTPAIVVVEVDGVSEGEPFVGQPSEGEGEPFTFPTQRIDVHVTRTIEGQTPVAFTLFKLGSAEEYAQGDPEYSVGERYLLFVRPRLGADGQPHADGTWLPVAPDGRLERLSSGELDPVIEGPIADELEGATIGEADRAIEQAQAAGP